MVSVIHTLSIHLKHFNKKGMDSTLSKKKWSKPNIKQGGPLCLRADREILLLVHEN